MSRSMKADEPLFRAVVTATFPPSDWYPEERTHTHYVGPYTSTGPARKAVTEAASRAHRATHFDAYVERASITWERIE